jgi:hypothetical protein
VWVGILFLPCGLLAGCGGSKGTVSGKVSYKDQPLKGGNVSIISKSGGVMSSPIEEDGSYKISKVPPGPATITVETKSLRPVSQKALPGPYAKAPKDALPPNLTSQGDAKRYVPIPEQYADPEKSGLSLDVKSGSQTHNIDLK